MSQVTEQSVRFQTALASIKLIQASAVLDLTEDDFDFLTSNKVWIATDRSRARRCVEACVYFFFSSRRRHTRWTGDWSSDVCSSDLMEALYLADPLRGGTGIAHTRWATHGVPSEANAHPHMVGRVALVHNGIIENYASLRSEERRVGKECRSRWSRYQSTKQVRRGSI